MAVFAVNVICGIHVPRMRVQYVVFRSLFVFHQRHTQRCLEALRISLIKQSGRTEEAWTTSSQAFRARIDTGYMERKSYK
jgi:hypothetical protein